MRVPAAQLRFLRHREVSTPEPARVPAADGRPDTAGRAPKFVSMWWVVAGCLAVAAVTLLFPSTPTYDPWAWILWGREIVHFDLTTTGGPSWKPLPILFTVPFSAFDLHTAPFLWLWIARAGGLLACVMAYRIARRLVGPDWYGLLAGVAAALALFSSFKYVRDAALGNSEAMLAGLFLWSFERHLDGRRDHALYLGFACALLRPEVWPFLGGYGLWLWFKEPRLRVRLTVLGALVPALWFLPEVWGSGDPFRAGSRANAPNPGSAAFAQDPALELVRRFRKVVIAPVKAGVIKEKANNTERVSGGLEHEAELWHDLKRLLDRNGGKGPLLACGGVFSGPFQTQMIAYELGIHGIQVGWKTTPPPGVAFRTRTVPDGPLVTKPTDDRFRLIDRYGKWRLLTVPPRSGGACPKASPAAPTAAVARVRH